MEVPTWVELAGRNAAAAMSWVSGTVTVATDAEGTQLTFRFWHGPQGRWRIELDDEPVYVSAPGEAPLVRVDGRMRRQNGDFGVAQLGAPMSPLDLLGEDSALRNMSVGMQVTSGPMVADVDGRKAWTTTLASRGGETGEITIDDRTGVVVEIGIPGKPRGIRVTALTEHQHLPEDLFRWSGQVEERDPRRGSERAVRDRE